MNNTSVNLELLKDQTTNFGGFWLSYSVMNQYENKILLKNYFHVGLDDFKIFMDFINNLSDGVPRKINVKINQWCYENYIKKHKVFLVNEHLTPKEEELGIRTILVKKPSFIFDENKYNGSSFQLLYKIQI